MRFVVSVKVAGQAEFSRSVIALNEAHATDVVRETYERLNYVVYAVDATEVEQFADVSNVLNGIS